jgi:predicted transposase/invertase (TIGR01784 family)
VFDLQCVDKKGRYFILEMQFGKQPDFIKRAHFGISLRYAAQAEKGATHGKAFNIPAIYHLSFLDFELDFGKGCDEPVQYISLHNDEHPEVVYDIVHMAFVQLPKFLKTATECKTSLEKLIFVIKNAEKLKEQPENFKGKMFDSIFHLAEISRFTEKERLDYEAHMKYLNAYRDSLAYAKEEGIAMGEARGIAQGETIGSLRQAQKIAKWMLAKGMSIADIEDATGLSEPEILVLE